MKIEQKIHLASDVDVEDLLNIHPRLHRMLGWYSEFCFEHGIKCVLTSVIRSEEDNAAIGAVSLTHVQGRAFDASLRSEHGWTPPLIDKMKKQAYHELYTLGAVSGSTLKPRPVYVHGNADGPGIHAHFQCKP